jgi:antitoxin (DNA-binding transcriptional repressor) of toxin-antitoxin stability system
MRVVGLKLLKNKLAEFVHMAEAGEHILVTDRDRVVAELRPAEGRGPFVADALLADAMRCGWVSAPVNDAQRPPTPPSGRPHGTHSCAAVRTLDVLHLASLEFLRAQRQTVSLAAYDERQRTVAKRLRIPLRAL